MKNLRPEYILTINSGSSSLKFGLFDANTLQPEISGEIAELRPGDPHFMVKDNQGKVLASHAARSLKLAEAEKELISFLHDNRVKYPVKAIGHRIVQGGAEHRSPEAVTPELLKSLQRLIYLAPNHLPDELSLIKKFGDAFPGVQQVACFDTWFHREMPDYAYTYALPAAYREKGLMRYGFHGLSCESVLAQLIEKHSGTAKKKIIIVHLGGGSSITAVKNALGIDTTMGISPLGGLVMSSRPGDLDPGALLFILHQDKALTASQLGDLLSHKSGLKGIAGEGDMSGLLERQQDSAEARLAVALFCYQAMKYIGAMAAALGGLDLLVFTGGIGENAPEIRKRICDSLGYLGVELSQKHNNANRHLLSKKNNHVKVRAIPANEALMLARHTFQVIHHSKQTH